MPTLLRVRASLTTPNAQGEPPDSSGVFFFGVTPNKLALINLGKYEINIGSITGRALYENPDIPHRASFL